MSARAGAAALLASLALLGCGPPEPAALPPATFAFGVFGDAPYSRFDQRAYDRLIEDVGASDVAFLIHVGDLHGGQCSDGVLEARRRAIAAIAVPVIYTPGDNEWTDCHGGRRGGFRPLERLDRIRRTYFRDPGRSLGARTVPLVSQAMQPEWSEFVENARWAHGRFLFTTIHLVGSRNGMAPFAARTAADDRAATRRMAAALHWLDEAFAVARRDSMRGLVIAIHADPFFELRGPKNAFEPFIARLEARTRDAGVPVILLHGDSHVQRADQPLLRAGTTDTVRNFHRVETFGSPDVGWVRIVLDSANGRLATTEPRLMPKALGL